VAAAVFAEVSAVGLLHVTSEAVRPSRVPTDISLDSVAAEVVARVLAEPQPYSARDWLVALSQDAVGLVGRRMAAAGMAVERGVRRGLRRDVVFLPVDPIAAAWPAARLSTGVRGHRSLEPADVFLLGLAAATPLGEDLFADSTAAMRERALARLNGLPVPWVELLETTRVAVASGVMANR
jgi:hypothetical protein